MFKIVAVEPAEIKPGDLLVSPPTRISLSYSIIGIVENVRKAEQDLDANWIPDFYIVDVAHLDEKDAGAPGDTVYSGVEKAYVLRQQG